MKRKKYNLAPKLSVIYDFSLYYLKSNKITLKLPTSYNLTTLSVITIKNGHPPLVLHTRTGILPRNSSTISADLYHWFCLSVFSDSFTRCLVARKMLENSKVFESSRRFSQMDCSIFAPCDFLTIRMLLDACPAHIVLLRFKF